MTRNSALASTHPASAVLDEVGDSTVVTSYTSVDEEYAALRERAGVVDHSGATLIKVAGPAANAFVQRVLARDAEYLTPERAMTSLVLAEDGDVVDIVTVWGHDDGAIIESSVGAGSRLMAHLRAYASDGVELSDLSGDQTTIGIEGPYSWGVVGRLLDPELAALPLNSVVNAVWDDVDVMFARTGSTGEYGYKIIVPLDRVADLWTHAVAEATAVGLTAFEAAMLEVRQPIVRRELINGVAVIESGAGWLMDVTDEEFIGRDAVVTQQEGALRRTVGFRASAAVPDIGAVISIDDVAVGEVAYAVAAGGQVLGLARIDADLAAAGIFLDAGDVRLETLSSPYVTPKSWSIPIV